jgi:DNA-binding NarL/FixJ family response regulator
LPQLIGAFAPVPEASDAASVRVMPSHLGLVTSAGPSAATSPIHVVLAEDHSRMRRCLRALLDSERDIEVVAEAQDLTSTAREVDSCHPEVLVLAMRLGGRSTMHAIEGLRERAPGTNVIVLTMQASSAFAAHAAASGAVGFALKDSADDELPEAIRCAARGQSFTSPRVRPDASALMPLRAVRRYGIA